MLPLPPSMWNKKTRIADARRLVPLLTQSFDASAVSPHFSKIKD